MEKMKRVLVVLGYESSGSVFAAKVISYVTGKCLFFGEWHGYGFNGSIGDDLVILHRSIPYRRPKLWHDDPQELLTVFKGYDVQFIICTRDLSISHVSRMKRFGGTIEECISDSQRATKLFEKIIKNCRTFVFSYETMIALEFAYFKELYRWLNIESEFRPEIKDANARYISQF